MALLISSLKAMHIRYRTLAVLSISCLALVGFAGVLYQEGNRKTQVLQKGSVLKNEQNSISHKQVFILPLLKRYFPMQ